MADETKPTSSSSPFGEYNPSTASDKPWKVLLYGFSGSGKTFMAGTFPDPLFLDLEDGMRSLLDHPNKILRYPQNSREKVNDLDQVKEFYQTVKKIKPSQAPFKTIVIDSLNELQLLIMDWTTGKYSAQRLYDDQPTLQDYGKLARETLNLVRMFIDLPYNIVFTAVAKDREYEEDKVFPMFIGKKTAPEVRRVIEQIGYCFTVKGQDGNPQHVVGFADHPQYLAKDRTRKLKLPIPNSYKAIVSKLGSSKGE